MKLGITYNLKSDVTPAGGEPDDRYEEFDSEETISSIEAALHHLGHDVIRLGWGAPMLDRIFEIRKKGQRLDGVFNLAEGVGGRGRESQVPACLEMLGIPFTGSDALTLALALDKSMAKRMASSHGIRTAPFRVISSLSELDELDLTYPLFVKPALEGSSMGITDQSLCPDRAAIRGRVPRMLSDYGPVLVEEFLPGDEFTVGIVGNGDQARVLGTMQVTPRQAKSDFVYSLEMKRNYRDLIEYIIPPRIAPAALAEVEKLALDAFRVFGCNDVTRVDIRNNRDGRPSFIEMNPLPGMNPSSSDLIILARGYGVSYEDVIGAVVGAAEKRWRENGHPTRISQRPLS
ncbi:MAG TPA: D-alanine--D-alanine ligase [Thermoanaerobaculia bacterium]|nr:D-alanine--D-alanine ligase [Thermoanaerobaculia bacterium]